MKYLLLFFTSLAMFHLNAVEIIAMPDGEYIETYGELRTSGPRIAFLTVVIGDEYEKNVEIGTQSKRDYCKKHGYDFIVAKKPIRNCFDIFSQKERHPAWTKISLAAKYLPKYDFIFFADADSLIMNDNITLQSLNDPKYDLIISSEIVFPDPDFHFNTGIWIMKNTSWSEDLLKATWIYGETSKYATEHSWEQASMQYIMEQMSISGLKPQSHYKILHHSIMHSSTSTYRRGEFIIHLMQFKGAALKAAFEDYNKKRI